ncbi:hypothetical protein [Polaromonas sp. C04]|uniref:hypothetical protein n=1 Tax=Polaromonas sp. C04 TaxID=1945857 RepID=UPI00143B7B56|nr:hypothetical protein [Polaromonas sp. C04]
MDTTKGNGLTAGNSQPAKTLTKHVTDSIENASVLTAMSKLGALCGGCSRPFTAERKAKSLVGVPDKAVCFICATCRDALAKHGLQGLPHALEDRLTAARADYIASQVWAERLMPGAKCGNCGKLFSPARKPGGVVRLLNPSGEGHCFSFYKLCRACYRAAHKHGRGGIPNATEDARLAALTTITTGGMQ